MEEQHTMLDRHCAQGTSCNYLRLALSSGSFPEDHREGKHCHEVSEAELESPCNSHTIIDVHSKCCQLRRV